MNLRTILTFLILLVVLASACRKTSDDPNPDQNQTMNDLVIPQDFNWETYKDVSLDISVDLTQNTTAVSKISVYKGNPGTDGKLVVSGSVSPTEPFQATFRLPASLEEIFVMCEFPFGGSQVQSIPVENLVNYTFSNAKSSNLKSGFKSTSEVGPGCDDCDLVISGNGSYNIGNGDIVCVTENFTGSVTFENWTGAGTLQALFSKTCGLLPVITILTIWYSMSMEMKLQMLPTTSWKLTLILM